MLPRIMGKMPYFPFPGAHSLPNRNWVSPIWEMAGKALLKRNMQMRATERTLTQALSKNSARISFSFAPLIALQTRQWSPR